MPDSILKIRMTGHIKPFSLIWLSKNRPAHICPIVKQFITGNRIYFFIYGFVISDYNAIRIRSGVFYSCQVSFYEKISNIYIFLSFDLTLFCIRHRRFNLICHKNTGSGNQHKHRSGNSDPFIGIPAFTRISSCALNIFFINIANGF